MLGADRDAREVAAREEVLIALDAEPQPAVQAVDRLVGTRVCVRGDGRAGGPSVTVMPSSPPDSAPVITWKATCPNSTCRGPSPARRKYGFAAPGKASSGPVVASVYGSSGKYFIANFASAAPNFSNGGGLGSTCG